MTVNPDQIHLPITEFQSLWETNGIFSDHYMRTRLKESVIWPDKEIVKPIWEFCKSLWNKRYFGLTRSNEEVLRLELLNPILEQLGFGFLPNISMPVGKKRKEPDYILFADEKTKDEVFGKSKYSYYAAAVAVLEAKRLNHALDSASKKETPGKFPDRQILDYLHDAMDQSRKPYFNWAVLTNGMRWRLYCRNSLSSDYFEINFEVALSSFQNFIVFYTLFCPTAFVQDSESKCPLDYLREEALQVQTKLEDDLRKRVFNILRDLANGFYKNKENHIGEDDRNILYDNCLIFLYRLLFILYAEGRGLLPVKPGGIGSNKHYIDHYSIVALIPKLKSPLNYDSDEFTELYERLLGLFHLINGNQPSRNKACQVPQYNGGLFDHTKHRLLEKWRLGERTLAEVLRGLIFSSIPISSGETLNFDFGETIDYADLQVRQLGSIYEGLLEHHLELEGSHIELRGDRSDRKATGTYYTPDYIVQYIVGKTLLPLCERIEKLPKVQKAKEERIEDNSFAEEVLKLNVLDPAMGSGHFLVRATEFLAEQVVYHQTTALHIKEVSRGLSHEQTEISYWRRRVVESCIYGVDLNPLAVELAKLSLWLTCIAVKQPLSFLDHHLRPGNSLIGAKLSELGSLPEKNKTKQISFSFGPDLIEAVSNAIKAIIEIEETETIDVLTVKNKETRWEKEVHDRLKPYRMVADLWISTFFGLEISKTNYQQLANRIAQNPKPRTKEAKTLRKELMPFIFYLSNAKNELPFHWELEFPEVFFNEDGSPRKNPGFDAVIGNPPYGASFNKDEKIYLTRKYIHQSYQLDSYLLFLEQSINYLLAENGLFGMIIPNPWLTNLLQNKMRRLVITKTLVCEIVHFLFSVFPKVTVNNQIVILQKSNFKNWKPLVKVVNSINTLNKLQNFENIQEITHSQDYWIKLNGQTINIFLSMSETKLSEKLRKKGVELSKLCNINVGIKPYQVGKGKPLQTKETVEKRIFDSNSPIDRSYRKYLRGKDIHRYIIAPIQPRFLKYGPWLAEPRPSANFNAPVKIIMRQTGDSLIAALDTYQYLCLNNMHVIVPQIEFPSMKYILGIINSKLINWYYQVLNPERGEALAEVKKSNVAKLPIFVVDTKNKPEKFLYDKLVGLVDRMLDLSKKLSNAEMDNERESLKIEIDNTDKQIDNSVYELYDLKGEEIEIV